MTSGSKDRSRSVSGVSVGKVVSWLKSSQAVPAKLIGGFLRHRDGRWFEVTSAEQYATGRTKLTLCHGESLQSVDAEGLADRRWWKEFLLPQQISAEIEQAKACISPEVNSEWTRLKEAFRLSRPDLVYLEPEGTGLAWRVYHLLVRLGSSPDEALDDDTLAWLEKNQLYTVLGSALDQRFKSRKNLWDAARASACWRKARFYREALLSTHSAIQTPNEDDSAKAACYVSRAAVLRDLKRYSEATDCLWQAELLGGNPGHIALVRSTLGRDGW